MFKTTCQFEPMLRDSNFRTNFVSLSKINKSKSHFWLNREVFKVFFFFKLFGGIVLYIYFATLGRIFLQNLQYLAKKKKTCVHCFEHWHGPNRFFPLLFLPIRLNSFCIIVSTAFKRYHRTLIFHYHRYARALACKCNVVVKRTFRFPNSSAFKAKVKIVTEKI